ncbi:MAG: nucleotidyltransferase [Eubacteriaceae bacterium]|nr:nucleotidyltransferase [Eubacteriaceae bacterium]
MISAGIVAEYNPFHNGHYYHINKTKSQTGADVIICVLSTDFVQRGEAAVCNKFLRAQMALSAGADLVVMLPFAYSCQGAEIFAYGSVNILNQLSCDYISFGCEDDNLQKLNKAAEILSFEENNFKDSLKNHLFQGRSYAKSRQLAAEEYNPELNDILCSPNNILAVEYLKQIILNNYPIKPQAVKRAGANHNSLQTDSVFASASQIRQMLKAKDNGYINYVPGFTANILKDIKINDIENYKNIIYQNLLVSSAEKLSAYPDISLSLANKIINNFSRFTSVSDFIDKMSDKHHTKSRISRSLCHIICGFDIPYAELKSQPVPYIRLLGFNENGRKYLSHIKDNKNIVSNTNDFFASSTGFARRIFTYDLIASDLFNLGIGAPKGIDYKTVPIYFD